MSADIADWVEDDPTAAIAVLPGAGLFASPSDLAAVVANHADIRALTAILYGVAEVRYEEPAITFTPDVGASGTAPRGA
jgi:hypothetical protein